MRSPPADTRVAPAAAKTPARRPKVRAYWLKQLHTWHSISAAVSLAAMLLFAVTGLTLNHAASIGATPRVTKGEGRLTAPLLAELARPRASDAPLPAAVARAVVAAVHLDPGARPAEWSDDEVYVAMPGPGSDAWVSIDRVDGTFAAEATWRGWISYANDLHKGRNTGGAWFWFIDVFAAACIVFTATGLILLQMHARHRPSTWPMVALGVAVPLLIAIFLIH